MNVNDLLKDELEFELACRGIYNIKTVNPMRTILKEIIERENTEKSSIKLVVPKCCIEDPLSEIILGENKLRVLKASLDEISGKSDSHSLKRLFSRLIHLQARAKLIIPASSDFERHLKLCNDTKECYAATLSLFDKPSDEEEELANEDKHILYRTLGDEGLQIIAKIESKDHAKAVNSQDVDIKGSSQQYSTPQCSNVKDEKVQERRNNFVRTSTLDTDFGKRKLVPIKDWGIKFSGKSEISINAFIERVNELKEARNADDEDLWRYAIDFFEGEALIWFRAHRDYVQDWNELVDLLLATFQRPFYQDELLEEIRNRTQGRQESANIYLAVMQNMFNRLPEKLTETQKLAILLKNIQPYFQQAVCRDRFNSVSELSTVLRILERTKFNCDRFQEPHRNLNVLEPDLAYQQTSSVSQVNAISRSTINSRGGNFINNQNTAAMKCWNCRVVGHTFRNCTVPRQRLFCYKCGKFGQTTSNCKCKNSGNESKEVIVSAKCLPN